MSIIIANILSASENKADRDLADELNDCKSHSLCHQYKFCKTCTDIERRKQWRRFIDTLKKLPPHRVFYVVGALDNVAHDLKYAINTVRKTWIKIRKYLEKSNKHIIYGDQYKIEIAKSRTSGFKPHINVMLVVSRSTYIKSKEFKKKWEDFLPGMVTDFKSRELKTNKDWETVKNYIEKSQRILYDESITYEVIDAMRSKKLMMYSGELKDKVAIVDAEFKRKAFIDRYPNLCDPEKFHMII